MKFVTTVSLMADLKWTTLCLLTILVYGPLPLATAFQESPPRSSAPNILFLFADDLSYEAVGYAKRYNIQTPNLDRLAARGIVFSHAHNMGSFSPAVCVASRTMLVTGRSVWRAESIYKNVAEVRDAQEMWPQLLKKAGYETYMTGKWHVPVDAKTCFDRVGTVRAGMPNDKPKWYSRPIEGEPDTWNPADESLGGYWTGGKHWSEVTATEAEQFIASRQHQVAPFFAYVAFNAPHDPRQAPQAHLDRYPVESIALPESYADDYPYAKQIGCGPGLRDERLAPFPRTPFAIRTHRREYYALITHLDEQIGKILAALQEAGQDNNTWIFFTADHGLAVGSHGLLGKQNMYEHSLRVPCIVAGPGIKSPRVVDERIYLQDIVPTTLQLAGVTPPATHEFRSLLPLIDEQPYTARPGIYGAYLDAQRAYIQDHFKLIVYPKANVERLFDLEHDPLELVDLAKEPEYQARIAELTAALEAEETRLRN
jgi:arylsulfatase A-like enzyme